MCRRLDVDLDYSNSGCSGVNRSRGIGGIRIGFPDALAALAISDGAAPLNVDHPSQINQRRSRRHQQRDDARDKIVPANVL